MNFMWITMPFIETVHREVYLCGQEIKMQRDRSSLHLHNPIPIAHTNASCTVNLDCPNHHAFLSHLSPHPHLPTPLLNSSFLHDASLKLPTQSITLSLSTKSLTTISTAKKVVAILKGISFSLSLSIHHFLSSSNVFMQWICR